MRMQVKIVGTVLIGVLSMFASIGYGQEQTCTVKPREGGAYDVKIGETSFIAVPKEKLKQYMIMEGDLKTAQEKIQALNETIASQGQIDIERKKQIADLNQLVAKNQEYASKLENANAACEKAMKACCGGSNHLSLEGGIGLTGDSKAAGLLGVGYGMFRAWGFFESGNSGALVGLSYPLPY